MFIRVFRDPKSYSYIYHNDSNEDFNNNSKNNSIDDFYLFSDDGSILLKSPCQSVANVPDCDTSETLAVGKFSVRCFVEHRSFWCDIHGIFNAYDEAGRFINLESIELGHSETRWLIHDWQKLKPYPQGTDCFHAWSEGCLVLPDAQLHELNNIIRIKGASSGDIIEGELILKE